MKSTLFGVFAALASAAASAAGSGATTGVTGNGVSFQGAVTQQFGPKTVTVTVSNASPPSVTKTDTGGGAVGTNAETMSLGLSVGATLGNATGNTSGTAGSTATAFGSFH